MRFEPLLTRHLAQALRDCHWPDIPEMRKIWCRARRWSQLSHSTQPGTEHGVCTWKWPGRRL